MSLKYAAPPRKRSGKLQAPTTLGPVDTFTPSEKSWAPLALAAIAGLGALTPAPQAQAAEACFTTDMAMVEDAELMAKLEKAVSRLEPIKKEGDEISVGILDSFRPNAVPCPDHNLFFTRGLVERFDADELLFAAGHEYGHTRDDHFERVPPKSGEEASPAELQEFRHGLEREGDCVGLEALQANGVDQAVARRALLKLGGGGRGSSTHPSLSSRLEALAQCELPQS